MNSVKFGITQVVSVAASAPAITGSVFINKRDVQVGRGAFSADDSTPYTRVYSANGNGGASQGFNFNASRSSPIYGASNTIRPISRKVMFMIRF